MASGSVVCIANREYYSDFLRKQELNRSNFEETNELSFNDFVNCQRENKQEFVRSSKAEFRANTHLYFDAEHDISSTQLQQRHAEVKYKMF